MKKNIVIVDIDGTISKVGDRLKYLNLEKPDWDSFYEHCDEDEPIDEILNMVSALQAEGRYEIVYCSGRRESVRGKTNQWLAENGMLVGRMLLRKDNDWRHDAVIKPELLEKEGITKDQVAFILEDRNSMVNKWREIGFTCLQVADGDF